MQFAAAAPIRCNDGPIDSVWEFHLGATIPFRLGNIPGCLWSRVSFLHQAFRFNLSRFPAGGEERGEWLTAFRHETQSNTKTVPLD